MCCARVCASESRDGEKSLLFGFFPVLSCRVCARLCVVPSRKERKRFFWRREGRGKRVDGLGNGERERVSCYGGVLLVAAAGMDRSASSFAFALVRELLTFARVPVAATTSARLAASTSYSLPSSLCRRQSRCPSSSSCCSLCCDVFLHHGTTFGSFGVVQRSGRRWGWWWWWWNAQSRSEAGDSAQTRGLRYAGKGQQQRPSQKRKWIGHGRAEPPLVFVAKAQIHRDADRVPDTNSSSCSNYRHHHHYHQSAIVVNSDQLESGDAPVATISALQTARPSRAKQPTSPAASLLLGR